MAETLETIKKYTGPFSGSQMDQIFYEILNFTSERYAKGTANGQAVAAGTIGYNDNSYYYSRQALQSAQAAANAAARAESAVPAGINSAVLWTTDQSTALTDANKAVARKNIMAGGSNPNLLDNWWFATGVVNQRGATSGYTAASHYNFIDRWLTSYGSTRGEFSIGADGITLTSAASTNANIQQKLLNPSLLHGKTLTASVMLSDGTILSGTKVYASTDITSFYSANNMQFLIGASGNFVLYVTNGTTRTFKAVKLELGTVSTLANDAPPKRPTEELDCQYYFQRFQIGLSSRVGTYDFAWAFATNSTTAYLSVPLFRPMRPIADRSSYTVAYGGSVQIFGASGKVCDVSAISLNAITTNTATFTLTGSGLTAGQMYRVILSNAYIDLSADL